MKTKLTLTVHKRAIENAKRYSRKTGKSVSRLFEEIFENPEIAKLQTSSQKAATRLLNQLAGSASIKSLNDKQLIKDHVARKFA